MADQYILFRTSKYKLMTLISLVEREIYRLRQSDDEPILLNDGREVHNQERIDDLHKQLEDLNDAIAMPWGKH